MNFVPETLKPPRRTTLHEELTQRLRDLIIHGELQPGMKVPERDLCEAYDVSRTPLREALKVLAAQNLIRSRRGPAGGTFVNAPDDGAAVDEEVSSWPRSLAWVSIRLVRKS